METRLCARKGLAPVAAMIYGTCRSAQVAELVDAQVSGTCGRKVVEVRVFSWAPSTPNVEPKQLNWVCR